MVGDEVRHRRQLGRLHREAGAGERAGHVLADDRQHPLEHRERLMLIFVDRLLLGVGAQVNDLPERVEHREMLLPVMIEALEQEALLDLHPGLG